MFGPVMMHEKYQCKVIPGFNDVQVLFGCKAVQACAIATGNLTCPFQSAIRLPFVTVHCRFSALHGRGKSSESSLPLTWRSKTLRELPWHMHSSLDLPGMKQCMLLSRKRKRKSYASGMITPNMRLCGCDFVLLLLCCRLPQGGNGQPVLGLEGLPWRVGGFRGVMPWK